MYGGAHPETNPSERTQRRVGVMRYSNYGYVIAGAALEHLTATSWEELMRVRLFGPLEMNECGFGPPDSSDASQPWGHDGYNRPTSADNWSVLGPAGASTVHLRTGATLLATS